MWIDKDKNTIAICWGVEDAARVGKKRGLKLSKKECQDVLERVLSTHDATLGVSWDTLDDIIIHLFSDRIRRTA
jgi:hypothetical protein